MSAAQHQALVLGSVSFVAFIVFLCFLLPSRRTRFSVFAACNLLFVALMFGAVALVDLSGGRAEIMVALMTELPVVLIVAWVCLALAGGLPAQLPAEPVARRPWLRAILGSAPLVLLLSVGLATAVGLIWPSPALRVYAPAPPRFFVLKGLIMAPEAIYSGFAAMVFVMAGRATGLKRRFYFKNLAFSVGMVCIALIALESTVFAGLRVWLSGEGRRAILETLNTLEACLAICCILAFTAGLSLRYTPCRCHDAPAQASDRMAPYPGTVRVPRMAGRQFWCGRPVGARIRRRCRGVSHKGSVRVGHAESPGYDPTCSRHERSFERDTANYARCGAQALRTPGRDPVRRCPGIENKLGCGLEITRPRTSDGQVCATTRCAKGSTRTCR
jgi:hypothetical protein